MLPYLHAHCQHTASDATEGLQLNGVFSMRYVVKRLCRITSLQPVESFSANESGNILSTLTLILAFSRDPEFYFATVSANHLAQPTKYLINSLNKKELYSYPATRY